MRRLLLFLPLCLFLAPTLPRATPGADSADRPPRPADNDKNPLPGAAEMERLARNDPVKFLHECLRSFDRNVQGYTAVLRKQERLNGKLELPETIEVAERERPFSVSLHWVEGARLALSVLYVAGENDGNMLVRPALALARGLIVQRDPEGADARQSGRYTIKEFGIRKGMVRTLESWKAAQDKGELHVEFLGTKRVKEAGDRDCLVLRRTRYAKPEMDGVTELTVYIDKENWLQVGSVLKGDEGKVIGAYYFRDVKINPDFPADQFTRAGIKP
jgi:hypothetical protein